MEAEVLELRGVVDVLCRKLLDTPLPASDGRASAPVRSVGDAHESVLVAQSGVRPAADTAADADGAAEPRPRPESPQFRPRSRRMFFKAGLGAAAAAAAVASPALTKSAAAADGGNMVLGASNTSEGGNTRLNGSGAGIYSSHNILTVSDGLTSSSYEAAVGAYGLGDRVHNGLYAFTSSRNDTDTTSGHAVVARMETGGRSHLVMPSAGGDPRNDSFAHVRGAVRSTGGDLWFCVSSGTPGTWRKLAGFSTAGSVHALTPRRVYDSRFGDGPLTNGGVRTISVADSIDINTGAVNGFGIVPNGATALMFNIAVVNTVGIGFLAATSGDATGFSAASINWSATGQILNNGTMSAINFSRQLKVFGGGTADFIVDVTGYTL